MRLRLATRGSQLATTQSRHVAEALQRAHPGLQVELVTLTSTGDRIQDRPLHEFGGKGLFTKEVELALLAGEADLAVHSYKDVPVTMPLVEGQDLVIAAVPAREDVRDVLVWRAGDGDPVTIGTGSLRRRALLREVNPRYGFVPMRGNVDTRLRRVTEGEVDAVVLAAAGLRRLGLLDNLPLEVTLLEATEIVPAAGQGALAVQCRADRGDVRELLSAINHEATARSVTLERRVVQALEADCTSPLGVYHDGQTLHVAVGDPDLRGPVYRGRGGGADPVGAALADLQKQTVVSRVNG